MSSTWLKENQAKHGEVPQEFIDEHVEHCRRKKKGLKNRQHCAVSLYYDSLNAGVEPLKSHADLPKEPANG